MKPGGRVLAVDFGGAQSRLFARFHRHGHTSLTELEELLSGAGMNVIEKGPVGTANLQYALAAQPSMARTDSSANS